ncbi:MAG: phosphoribosyl-AMP cyclohydrolase [Desulfobacter sp.]|jgi:phosphoribosyl-AMP cyclohydrolase|nr:phosphoribosyl-AMP cyclohydrolase [Desulfobacter sp.]MBP9598030.1 phosphoribosyl-AMP cyclohydrolase [Desulfobacter sp.]MDQ1269539.1 phosphoribosyl-AMP cyclohydrolase [Thermodesulfobacteriota bacterium]HBT89855.1 phosphoribosyl-AMP cyclohydrolase [Desulfobacter sp.]
MTRLQAAFAAFNLSNNQNYKEDKKVMPELDFDKTGGLIPAIAQDADTGEVLMLAYMNQEAFEETLACGNAVYYSRSRKKLWKKGETSGHVQKVREIRVDCDNDTVLLKVTQVGGAACHKGYKSCFYKVLENDAFKIVEQRVFDPEEVYK